LGERLKENDEEKKKSLFDKLWKIVDWRMILMLFELLSQEEVYFDID
jgi:hypothetical protein